MMENIVIDFSTTKNVIKNTKKPDAVFRSGVWK